MDTTQLLNDDWTKTTWDLPTDPNFYIETMDDLGAWYAKIKTLPVYGGMPMQLRIAIEAALDERIDDPVDVMLTKAFALADEMKAIRRVRDPEYWGLPYGTIIPPGYKPVGKKPTVKLPVPKAKTKKATGIETKPIMSGAPFDSRFKLDDASKVNLANLRTIYASYDANADAKHYTSDMRLTKHPLFNILDPTGDGWADPWIKMDLIYVDEKGVARNVKLDGKASKFNQKGPGLVKVVYYENGAITKKTVNVNDLYPSSGQAHTEGDTVTAQFVAPDGTQWSATGNSAYATIVGGSRALLAEGDSVVLRDNKTGLIFVRDCNNVLPVGPRKILMSHPFPNQNQIDKAKSHPWPEYGTPLVLMKSDGLKKKKLYAISIGEMKALTLDGVEVDLLDDFDLGNEVFNTSVEQVRAEFKKMLKTVDPEVTRALMAKAANSKAANNAARKKVLTDMKIAVGDRVQYKSRVFTITGTITSIDKDTGYIKTHSQYGDHIVDPRKILKHKSVADILSANEERKKREQQAKKKRLALASKIEVGGRVKYSSALGGIKKTVSKNVIKKDDDGYLYVSTGKSKLVKIAPERVVSYISPAEIEAQAIVAREKMIERRRAAEALAKLPIERGTYVRVSSPAKDVVYKGYSTGKVKHSARVGWVVGKGQHGLWVQTEDGNVVEYPRAFVKRIANQRSAPDSLLSVPSLKKRGRARGKKREDLVVTDTTIPKFKAYFESKSILLDEVEAPKVPKGVAKVKFVPLRAVPDHQTAPQIATFDAFRNKTDDAQLKMYSVHVIASRVNADRKAHPEIDAWLEDVENSSDPIAKHKITRQKIINFFGTKDYRPAERSTAEAQLIEMGATPEGVKQLWAYYPDWAKISDDDKAIMVRWSMVRDQLRGVVQKGHRRKPVWPSFAPYKDVSYRDLLLMQKVDRAYQDWAATSSGSPASMALQYAAWAVFDIDNQVDYRDSTTKNRGAKIYEQDWPFLEAMVRAMYAETQDILASNDIDNVTLYRGMHLSGKEIAEWRRRASGGVPKAVTAKADLLLRDIESLMPSRQVSYWDANGWSDPGELWDYMRNLTEDYETLKVYMQHTVPSGYPRDLSRADREKWARKYMKERIKSLYPNIRQRLIDEMMEGKSNPGDTVPALIDTQPLSSWSSVPSVSGSFGTVFAASVPAERIIATTISGVGCSDEFEFVVIGGNADNALVRLGGE